MPNLAQLTDAYYTDPVPAELPVEQPYLGVPADPDGLRRVYINTPSREALPGEVATTGRPEPRPEPGIEENPLEVWAKKKAKGASLWDNFGMAGAEDKSGKSENKLLKKLFGLGGEERYQLWPEKVLREGLAGAGEVMDKGTNLGLRREDVTDIPPPQMPTIDSTRLGKLLGIAPVAASPQDDIIEKAQAISALAGSGGIGGTGPNVMNRAGADVRLFGKRIGKGSDEVMPEVGVAALGSAPFLRPALKYKDRLYKGKEGQQHMDVIPKELYPEFEKMAMSGEDISHYNFGFVNDKGQFLTREKALEYGINTGLIDPHAGKFGALTSTLMADSSKPGTAIEAVAKTASPFYSAVEHNLNTIPQSKMTGEQWLGTLSNKPGVKGEELDWTGLKSFLEENKGKPVTKAQIEEHLANNKVELKEVSKGIDLTAKQVFESNSNKKWEDLTDADRKAYSDIVERQGNLVNYPTKYHSYQLPGGENYREMLLTLPRKEITTNDVSQKLFKRDMKNLDESERQAVSDEMRKIHEAGKSGLNYKSPHWDEPNNLAHVRMNDRIMKAPDELKALNENAKKALETANDNKTSNIPMSFLIDALEKQGLKNGRDFIISKGSDKKSLHLEEIQSDWHQQGRKQGYSTKEIKAQKEELVNKLEELKTTKKDLEKNTWIEETKGKFKSGGEFANNVVKEFANSHGSPEHIKAAEEFNRIQNLVEAKMKPIAEQELALSREHMNIKDSGVPDAPFKKSWHELALKRMIREAAEKGYDRLSWTPGEAQAARYDLSKQIKALHYTKTEKGYLLGPETHTGAEAPINAGQPIKAEKLADFVGKDLADKIIKGEGKTNAAGDDIRTLEGVDLKIGGEGMKGFYDQIIPKALEKLGKEHGVKVKRGEVQGKINIVNKDGVVVADGFKNKSEAQKWIDGWEEYGRKQGSTTKAADIYKINDTKNNIYYIDIPQSLKNTALQKGFPLFSNGYMLVPVQHIPDFGDDRK